MIRIVLLCILITSANFTFAQSGWKHFPPKINFQPGNYYSLVNITDIVQDNGNMYFGCWTSGIDILKQDTLWERIDHRNTPLPIFNDWINNMTVKNDIIYAATRVGLLIVSKTDTILFDTNNSQITNSYVNYISLDSTGNLWFSSKSWLELSKYDGENFINYPIPSTNLVVNKSLITDKHNNIWYATIRGIVRFDGNNFIYWDSTNSPILNKEAVDYLYYDSNKDVFYVALSEYNAIADEVKPNSRLFKISNDIWEEINLESMPFSSSNVQFDKFTIDKDGNIYFLFRVLDDIYYYPTNNFMVMKSNGEWKVINIPVMEVIGIDFVPIKTLFIDEIKQFIWVGTTQNGVIRVNLDIINSVDAEITNLPKLWIRSISPNPISLYSKLEFFSEPNYSSELSIKIYDLLGNVIKDITNDLNYNPSTATGIVNFNMESIFPGMYYLNIRNSAQSRTMPICKF